MDRDLSVLHFTWFLLAIIVAGCAEEVDSESLVLRLEEGEVHLADGRFVHAEEEARRLLPEIERAFGGDSAKTADTLDLLVRSLDRQGRQREADTLAFAKRAVSIRESVGIRSLGMARSLNNLGILVWIQGDTDAARGLIEQALEIRRDVGGENDPLVAASMDNLGVLAFVTGEIESGNAMMERALALRLETLPPSHPDVGDSYASIGGMRMMKRDYLAARPLLEQAANIHLAAWAHPHPRAATSAHNLAVTCQLIGDFDCARTHYGHAMTIRDSTLSPGHWLRASTHEAFASMLHTTGDYAGARTHYRLALEQLEQREIAPNDKIAHALYNLGLLLVESGDLSEALAVHRRSLELRRRLFEPDDLRIAESESAVGRVLVGLGDIEAGKTLLVSALQAIETHGEADAPGATSAYIGLARVAVHEGRTLDARELLEKAIRIREADDGAESMWLVWPLTELGELLLTMREPSAAENAFRRARQALSTVAPLETAGHANLLVGIARSLAAEGEINEALPLALEAARIGRVQVALTIQGMAERQALLFTSVMNRGLDLALTCALARPDPQTLREVWDARIRSRALVLEELVRKNRLLSLEQGEKHGKAVAEYQQATSRLANLMVRFPQGISRKKYRQILDDARRSHELAEQRLGEQFRSVDTDSRATSGLSRVVSELPPRAVLVAYTLFDRDLPDSAEPSYGAFVLRSDTNELEFRDLGQQSEIDPLIDAWRTAIGTRDVAFRETGARLRERIWDPLGVSSDGSEFAVFVVPDGDLNLINFSTLPVNEDAYLIEQKLKFHVLTTERELTRPPTSHDVNGELLVMGGIDFDHAEDARSSPNATSGRVSPTRGTSSICRDFSEARFAPLAGTEIEAGKITEVWQTLKRERQPTTRGASGMTLLTGSEASEGNLKRLAPSSRMIHIATHGFFYNGACGAPGAESRSVAGLSTLGESSTESEPRIESSRLSGIVLAGANARSTADPGEEDGILTAREVGAMNLDAVELVVLSACETGVGDVLVGEGVSGLRRSFLVAGVDTLVMSLWRVDDKAAVDWMSDFYEYNLKEERAVIDAVYASSLDSLRRVRESGSRDHPFFWGSFVAAGNWQ